MSDATKKIPEFFKGQISKLPSFSQCKSFLKILKPKEKIFFLACAFVFTVSSVFLLRIAYLNKTEIGPARGGIYIEGMIGQPRFINPILATSDVDRDLVEISFSGLMKYDSRGSIIPDLAESYEIDEGKRIYEVTLKENIFWHDGKEITADDVLFTIKTVQNPEYKCPEITNWIGIEVEKVSRVKLIFKLDNSYFPFLERLTLKIIPKHIFEGIPAENFSLAAYNLQPVGSGPFKFQEIEYEKAGKIKSLTFTRHNEYHNEKPFLDNISFRFYDNKDQLYKGLKAGESQGAVVSEAKDLNSFKLDNFSFYQASLPRYFAVFFNPEKNDLLKKKEIRQALSLSVNESEVLEKIIDNYGQIINSPILPEIFGFKTIGKNPNLPEIDSLFQQAGLEKRNDKWIREKSETTFNFTQDLEIGSRGKEVESLQECLGFFPDVYPKAEISGYYGKLTEKAVINFQEKYKEEILEPWGFSQGTGIVSKTTRQKLNETCNSFVSEIEPVKFTLVTVDQPFLLETAQILKTHWEKLGLEIDVQAYSFNELSQNFIKPREYEMLLFGEILGLIPDPFPFWHSSRIKDPGLNLSLYKNEQADKFLENAREAEGFEELQENLEEFQLILVNDYPAIFLYSPDFVYITCKKIQGIEFGLVADPSKRFASVETWYMKTKRDFK